jgi:hypothetical protein
MTKARLDGLYLLLVGFAVFAVGGFGLAGISKSSLVDFRAVYYSARCLLSGHDPYNVDDMLRTYRSEEIEHRHPDPIVPDQIQAVTVYVYFPTASIFIAPFALLPWGPAHLIWMVAIVVSLVFAAWLVWSVAADSAPRLAGALAAFLLLNSVDLLVSGNVAGIVVSLCVAAVWCFLFDRYAIAGVICLAAALLIKPQDAVFIWLFFLLASGYRRRALQVAAAAALLGLASIAWVSHASPHWPSELRANLQTTSSHGGLSDPSPDAMNTGTAAMMTGLQTIVSVFRDDARIYNPVTYLVWAPLLIVWAFATMRSPRSPSRDWLALAAMAALSMLPTLHRPNDTKILLLTIPACAMLWAEHSRTRWIAVLLTAFSMFLTGAITIASILRMTRSLNLTTATLSGKLAMIALERPAPIILLITGAFFLWVYARRASGSAANAPA